MTSYSFKVVLLGQGCVGKTSLVLRYVSNVFNDSHQSTLQASFLKKQLYLDQDLVRLNIWDTAGQEKFHALGPIYYREAQGALLLYDVTSPDSLRKVRDWIRELNKMLGTHNVRLAIVGNKADLLLAGQQQQQQQQAVAGGNEQRAGQTSSSALVQEAVRLADELQNARHYLTSAKLNEGIGELFVSLSRRMIEQHKRAMASGSQTVLASARLMRRTRPSGGGGYEEDEGPGGGGGGGGGLAGARVLDGARRAGSTGNSSCQC